MWQMARETAAELMSAALVAVSPSTSLLEAARQMRDGDVGDVLVVEDDRLVGVVTDRDLVVRGIADEADTRQVVVADVCSDELVTASPDSPVDDVVALMRAHAIRRIPVTDKNGRVQGIISLGDLAIAKDPASALGDVSSAPPNQ